MRKVIGIDLGGTKVASGIIGENGKIFKKTLRDTASSEGKEDVLDMISETIEELLSQEILGVGIGSPGFIDSKEGKVLKIGGNIKDWANTDIRGNLSERFPNLPIFVENDANVAALCEHWIGGAKDLKSFVMLTLGTGVGGAIYLEGQGLLKGQGYQAGELGHSILYPFGSQCNCGQKGCLERYVSGSALERIYQERSGRGKKGKDIFRDKEDKLAREIVDEFTKNLAVYLVTLKNIFDPEGVIIGGGVINSRKYWWDDVIKSYKDFSNDPEAMKILPALYLNDAGMIGAGKAVFDNL